MQLFIQNNSFIQTTPRKRMNSSEQTALLMKLKSFHNRIHKLMNTSYIFQNLYRHKTEVIILTKIKPSMVKQICTESYIVFMDPKFFRREHINKIEFHKYFQIFLRK